MGSMRSKVRKGKTMAVRQMSWSVRVEALRARAQASADRIIGTPRKVRLDKNTCFCGTVSKCTVEILDVPGVRAEALYTMTLVGPSGFALTYQTHGE